MKKHINNLCQACLMVCLLLFSTSLAAQTAPTWLDLDARTMLYPSDSYYTGYSEVAVNQDMSREAATNRAKQKAVGELSDRVRVMVNTKRTATDVSYGGTEIDEQIYSKLSSLVQTASQTEVVGSNVQTYYDPTTRIVSAFAFVSRDYMKMYYQNQIVLHLSKVEGALTIASELAANGFKQRAYKHCLSVSDAFATIAYAQDVLTAIDPQASEETLQHLRSERLRNNLVQVITDLETSTYVYIECEEMVNGQSVVHIADRLPGLLTEQGCGCVFTDSPDGADYVIKVSARLERCEDAPNNIVFCYATATLSVLNTHTQKLQKPKIAQAKGGWTNGNYANATEEAFGDLTKQIANQIVPIIKK